MNVIERLKSDPDALVCSHWDDSQTSVSYFTFDGWVRQESGKWISSNGLRIYFYEDNNGEKPFRHSNFIKASELLNNLSETQLKMFNEHNKSTTVAEFIKELQKLDQSKKVLTCGFEDGYCDVKGFEEVKVAFNSNDENHWWFGPHDDDENGEKCYLIK